MTTSIYYSPTGTTLATDIWCHWNSTATTSVIWTGWNDNRYITASGTTFNSVTTCNSTVLDLTGSAKSKQQDLKIAIKARRERRIARERARELLRRVLTASQWLEYRRYGSVQIVGSLGGKYEVGGGTPGMVVRLDDDWIPVQKLCYHPDSAFVVEDRVAAVILDIKCDESRVREKANKFNWADNEQRRAAARRMHKKVVLME